MRDCDLCPLPIEDDELLYMQQLSIPAFKGRPARVLCAHPNCMDFFLGSRRELRECSELTFKKREPCSLHDGKS